MKVLFCTPEMAPFAKSGGLADVSAALPEALRQGGLECLSVMPLYKSMDLQAASLQPVADFSFPTGAGISSGRILKSGEVFFIENDDYFRREGLYSYASRDYPDNLERFAFFARACIELLRIIPDVDLIHCNDWQTALIPAYLKALGQAQTPCLFTIHNLAYQGIFEASLWPLLLLPEAFFTPEILEFYGNINVMKAGIVFSDLVSTVSPTYAAEIQTPAFGCGLEGLMRAVSPKLAGIINGIDTSVWDPATDRHLPRPFHAGDLAGKAAGKEALQVRMGLVQSPDTPLFGMISRLVEQKGVDLVLACTDELLAREAQLVILGSGDHSLEQALAGAARRHAGRLGVKVGFDEALAHLIEAGADFFLMPSRFEPCGLNQMISLRYGTLPIITPVGGLKDTVMALGEGAHPCGIRVRQADGPALDEALERALTLYRSEPDLLATMRATAMGNDFSWSASAGEYARLYHKITNFEERVSLRKL